jgi:pimeloyl-ACP methyl ester carboxylesterase
MTRPVPATASPDAGIVGSYDIDGPADALPILFLHGTRLTRSMWRSQVEALRDEFRVVAVDLPGHGALADRRFTLAAAADHSAAIIERVLGRPAVVVGLSLGGYVAMDLAARRPELVRGLVLSGATAEPIGPRAAPYMALAWVMDHARDDQFRRVNEWFFRRRFPAIIADPILADGFWSHGGAAALEAIAGERFLPRLAAYQGSTLILNGEYDVVFRLAAGTFARAAHDARRVRLRGASHLANLDRPAAFSAAVRRFAESLAIPD